MVRTIEQRIEESRRRVAATRRHHANLLRQQQAAQRKQENRRNIIAGRMLRAAVDEDAAAGLRAGETIRDWMTRRLDKTLTRNDERELFGLEPLAQPAEETGTEMANTGTPEPDTNAPTPGTAHILPIGDDGIQVRTPSWNADFATGFRAMGGRWSKSEQLWIGAPEHRLADVVTLARRCFGNVEHGTGDDPAGRESGERTGPPGATSEPEGDAKPIF